MRIVFFQWGLSIPPRAGSDTHTTKVAAELQKHGHEVTYLCFELQQDGPLPFPVHVIESADEQEAERWLPFGPVLRNLTSYWATTPGRLLGFHRALARTGCDVCVASGIHGLLCLHVLDELPRIWYAGDELTIGVLSQLSLHNGLGSNLHLLAEAARGLVFTRMSKRVPDEIWVVANKDARSMRRITGSNVQVIANGVDTEHYRPVEQRVKPLSAVFWGRLDFGPNEHAVRFLASQLWAAGKGRRNPTPS